MYYVIFICCIDIDKNIMHRINLFILFKITIPDVYGLDCSLTATKVIFVSFFSSAY